VLNAQQLVLNAQVQQVQNIATLVNSSYTVAAAAGRLTARDLNLPVQEYDDLKYYDAVKYAGFGTGEEADQAAGVAPSGALLAASPAPAITDGQAVPAAP
jgi:outer membrane protein